MNRQIRANPIWYMSLQLGGKRWDVWWKLLRPHTLTASFVPVAIGTALALPTGNLELLLFFFMLTASILIQAATNMFNEYYDFVRGLDQKDSVGIGGTIVREQVKPKIILRLAVLFSLTAVLLGVYLAAKTSWWIFAIGILCIFVGYFYSGGPFPISATPFGELVSGLFMGLVIILISFFIQTGYITLTSILASIPTSCLIGAILMANNIRDLDGDKEHGRKTLAILLGHRQAVYCLGGLFLFSYLWLVGLVVLNALPSWTLLALLSLPKARQSILGFWQKRSPLEMMPAMQAAAQTNTLFGLLLAGALLLHHILS